MGEATTIGETTADTVAALYNNHILNFGQTPTSVYVSREVYKSWKDECNRLLGNKSLSNPVMFMGMEITARDSFHDPIVATKDGSIYYISYRSHNETKHFTVHEIVMEYLSSVPSITKRGMFNNTISLKEERYFKNGMMFLGFKINENSIRTVGVSLNGNVLESISNYTERAHATLKAIPINAKTIPNNQLKNFNDKLIAGWLFDSQYKVYGIKEPNGTIRGYSCAITWIPTDEELIELTSYPEITK